MVYERGEIKKKVLSSKKYLKASELAAQIEMNRLRDEHPNWELKDVLSVILKDFPPEIPSQLLLQLTQFIVEEWEKIEMEEAVRS